MSEQSLQNIAQSLRTSADDLNRMDMLPMLAHHLRNAADQLDAKPAQAVDVGAIREVINYLQDEGNACIATGDGLDAQWGSRILSMGRKLARAISGEKAGPVDGWQFRWHTEGDDSLLLIAHPDHGGVGVHKDPTDARTIPEAMLYLLARDLLPTSPAPDKENL